MTQKSDGARSALKGKSWTAGVWTLKKLRSTLLPVEGGAQLFGVALLLFTVIFLFRLKNHNPSGQ